MEIGFAAELGPTQALAGLVARDGSRAGGGVRLYRSPCRLYRFR
jgi:hypothetical protein